MQSTMQEYLCVMVTHRSLPPLDHFPQRASLLKKVARLHVRVKRFSCTGCATTTCTWFKKSAPMSVRSSETKSLTLLRMDSFLACSEYGILKTSRSVLFAFELREASCRLRDLNFSRYGSLFSLHRMEPLAAGSTRDNLEFEELI